MQKKISFENLKGLDRKSLGLSEAEALARRSRFGSNEIVEVAGNPWLDLVKDTLKDPMIWFLTGIGTVFVLVGDTGEAIVLFIAILPLLFMDAFLHWRTQASTAGLKKQLATRVSVFRDGKEALVDSRDLVPGDVIVVSVGSLLPADGYFQNISNVQVDESILTGEAFPIHKQNPSLEPFDLIEAGETSVPSSVLGYAGTRVLTGQGQFRVLFTGVQTAYGEIVQSVAALPHERTPLQKSIAGLVRGLILGSAVFCLLLAVVRVYQGHGWLDALLSAATLAIAAIPEEFPVVFTFFLGVGVYRLAQKRALVRRAVSVENIGRVTYICTDKTGTITLGQLKLTHVETFGGLSEEEILITAVTASNPQGSDPVDLAIQDLSVQRGLLPLPRLQTFPFTEDRKRETVISSMEGQRSWAFLKGAPETVLVSSKLTDDERQEWRHKTSVWAREGHKVLACARKILTSVEAEQKVEPLSGFEFCGLMAFEDPPRAEVAPAMKYCRENGLRVLMVTGDHPLTASAIAKEVGLGVGANPVIASAEDDASKFAEGWLEKNPGFLKSLDVVARCTPLQKLQIVKSLKKQGELVAVTGDGVNDVPALKAADIGIAMGERGTRSAKEVSSIVLLDDNFKTIVNAIMEGRQLFSNLKMSFEYLLLFHIPFVVTAAAVPLFGGPLLYLPIHIVWLELVIHPTALFAFQQEASVEKKLPQTQSGFFSKREVIRLLGTGLGLALVLGIFFQHQYQGGSGTEFARSQVLALLNIWSAGLVLFFTHLKTRSSLFVFITTLLSSVVLIQTSIFSSLLSIEPLPAVNWFWTFGTVAIFLGLFRLGRRSL